MQSIRWTFALPSLPPPLQSMSLHVGNIATSQYAICNYNYALPDCSSSSFLHSKYSLNWAIKVASFTLREWMMTLLSLGFYNNNNICNCRGVLLGNKVNVLEGKLYVE